MIVSNFRNSQKFPRALLACSRVFSCLALAQGFAFGLRLWTLCQGQAFQFLPQIAFRQNYIQAAVVTIYNKLFIERIFQDYFSVYKE